eukprot:211073_1
MAESKANKMLDLANTLVVPDGTDEDQYQCDYIIYGVHTSKTPPKWPKRVIDDIRSIKLYSEEDIRNGYPRHLRGYIIGFIVVSQQQSGWFVDNKGYWRSKKFAYGHYCHGIVCRVELDKPIAARGSPGIWYISNDAWGKALKDASMAKFMDKIEKNYTPIHIGKQRRRGTDKFKPYKCKMISVINPMGPLMVMKGKYKNVENRDGPLNRL